MYSATFTAACRQSFCLRSRIHYVLTEKQRCIDTDILNYIFNVVSYTPEDWQWIVDGSERSAIHKQ
jgi:hypothetical protein